MLIVGIISSVITLLLKALLDYLQEGAKDKRERKKLLFQRKTDAAEKAMSWYQEVFDCFVFMQAACDELKDGYTPQAYSKYMMSSQKANKLHDKTAINLNPLYLYFDFSKIENSHGVSDSFFRIYRIQKEIIELDIKVKKLINSGSTMDSKDVSILMNQGRPYFTKLSEELIIQIDSITEIQKSLRKDYICCSTRHKGDK